MVYHDDIEKIWKQEAKVKKDDGAEEIRFTTTVPDMEHIQIVKTFRLAPKDYHVTLLFEFKDTRDPKVAANFETTLAEIGGA